MPLTDEQRRTVLSCLGTSRRLLRSDEPLLPDVREVIAQLLEQFEASVLVLDQVERQIRQFSDDYGRTGGQSVGPTEHLA